MTIAKAIRLLDPATTAEAIAEIEYYNGFSGRTAAVQAITDASIIACDIMRKYEQLERERDAAVEDLHGLCSVCKHNNTKVCDSCTHTASIFEVYGDADNWEWRGKQDARE